MKNVGRKAINLSINLLSIAVLLKQLLGYGKKQTKQQGEGE